MPLECAANGSNEERAGLWPLQGSRVGDHSAPALISLALDEMDARQVLDGRARPGPAGRARHRRRERLDSR
jgi:hypothetical protein